MNIRGLLKHYNYDANFIYEGLVLDVSTQLKELMEKRGLTKKQLAKKMRVRPSYITRIFSGKCNLTLGTIAKMLSALQVDGGILIKDLEEEDD